MTNNQFDAVANTIKGRRSIGWAKMNGAKVADSDVLALLELANWAPNHGKIEPWRFFVYTGEALTQFGKQHADLYWANTAEDKRQEATYTRLEHNVDKASHLIIAVMKRLPESKFPLVEDIAAASAATQNILLGATAMGIASFWSTGGMTHHAAMKELLGLSADDVVLGLIYLGYTDEPAKEGVRTTPVSEKVKWL